MNLKNKKVLVMGLGLHGGGVGVARWLVKSGAKVTITDLKNKEQLKSSIAKLKGLPVKYVLGRHNKNDFIKTDLIVKNPGVPDDSEFLKIAARNKVPVDTDIALFVKNCPAPIIGITGTKGKTTTTTLVGEIFKAAGRAPVVAGNIRVSPLDFLSKIKKDGSVILELSSWQLEGLDACGFSPHVSLITNITPDHLNRYQSFDHYVAAKAIIFRYQKSDDVCILNRDNAPTKKFGAIVPGKRLWFSLKYFKEENGSYQKNGWIWFRHNGREQRILPIKEIVLPGNHNFSNVLAAVALASICGIKPGVIRLVVKKFKGIPYRLELIRELRGVKYYNDTAATAPDGAINALRTLGKGKNIVLIAGGADKKLFFKDFAAAIKKHVKATILFKGSATPKIKRELLKVNYWAVTEVDSMVAALTAANKLAKKGDIVLLSPGCASFGLFINEFDRGDQFTAQVKKIK
ncbi:MAG: UDP-N-acetylmuramoyl-L-alanine--D-glutamate ligase [Patescibacteria group bacterium]|jgi:UDP-N-acetylmuramoylalanine--D-glutamate ligase